MHDHAHPHPHDHATPRRAAPGGVSLLAASALARLALVGAVTVAIWGGVFWALS